MLASVLEQVKEPIQILQDQAQLTRDEHAHRVEAEKRAEAAERQADERVEAAERAAQEEIAEVKSWEQVRYEHLRRSALTLYEENKELRDGKDALRVERNRLHEQVLVEQRLKLDALSLAREHCDRLTDIPMPDVMDRLGYASEQQGEAHVYRDTQGRVAIHVEQQRAFDRHGQLICSNSLDLVVHVRRHHQRVEEYTPDQALEWLSDEFGERRAAGAAVARQEQYALEFFSRRGDEWAHSLVREPSQNPWRGPRGRAEDHDRGARDYGSGDRGGGSRGFGGR